MTVAAIETSYAGCRFRSRLEARWAVFFKHMGIPWEYEPQGFRVSWRLDNDPNTFNYLPDFWLPEENVYAEVKGSLSAEEWHRLANAAASLSSNDGGGCHDQGGHDVVVLGPIPDPRAGRTPVLLHLHKGDLVASCWLCRDPCRGVTVGDDGGGIIDQDGAAARIGWDQPILGGFRCSVHRRSYYPDALAVARSARFEHGENPA